MYPDIANATTTDICSLQQYFSERAILAPRNNNVDAFNDAILSTFPGDEKAYFSADSYVTDDPTSTVSMQLPLELLNSTVINGFPLHKLALKVGCPVLLLRNLDPPRGLCNGTRMIITALGDKVLEAVILTGGHAGERAFIPRIGLDSNTESGLPISFRRFQFPLRVAFCMTINKSQGQSLKVIGLDLSTSVFAHGQLYVALSRATHPSNIFIRLPAAPAHLDNATAAFQTTNIVYRDLLRDSGLLN